MTYQPTPGTSIKDPNTAFIIEFTGGFFGLLGLGYFYVGRMEDGLIRVIGWMVYYIGAVIAISLLLAIFVGICCIPIQLAIQIGVPYWSASELKKKMLAVQSPIQNP